MYRFAGRFCSDRLARPYCYVRFDQINAERLNMWAVFFDVVDDGIKILECAHVASGGDERHVLQFLVFLVLIGNS